MTPDRPLFFKKDELYGELAFSQDELSIINTPQIQRLNDISLSAVPPITLGRQIPSRLEHSIGVAHLAKIVGEKPEFNQYSRELFAAGIAHDVGSPPFSHLSERFLFKVFGISHERFAEMMISNSQLEKELKSQGLDTKVILKLINGNNIPVSDVIAGSMDIDNLDNIQRYGQAMEIIEAPLYSGEKLAEAFTLHNGSVALVEGSENELEGWLTSRHKVYQYVYSAENQVMSAMLRRALQFAYEEGEITEDFFYRTDSQAYNYLLQNCNIRTRKLAKAAAKKQPYIAVTDLVIKNPSSGFADLCNNSDNRELIADSIADRLSLPRENICAYFGKSRNYRSVHLPVINGVDSNDLNEIQQEWTAQVFIHPDHGSKVSKINELFIQQVGLSGK